jgi:hypothetical protein
VDWHVFKAGVSALFVRIQPRTNVIVIQTQQRSIKQDTQYGMSVNDLHFSRTNNLKHRNLYKLPVFFAFSKYLINMGKIGSLALAALFADVLSKLRRTLQDKRQAEEDSSRSDVKLQ